MTYQPLDDFFVTPEIRRGKGFLRIAIIFGIIPFTLSLIELSTSAFAQESWTLPVMGILLYCIVGILLLPIVLYRARRLGTEKRFVIKGLVVAVIAPIVSLVIVFFLSWPLRKLAFSRTANSASTLIEAINRFQLDEGKPPDSLKDLVPKYLVAIPQTGLSAYPQFEYERFQDTGGLLLWWDLGSRGGAPITGLWVYPDGDPAHAILALELNGRDTVVNGQMDRLPDTTIQQTFKKEVWLVKPEQRLQMVKDLAKKHGLVGQSRREVERLLGPPTGSRILRDSPWELRIQCPSGILNWDVFFYWPTERYPEELYGGGIERIGKWAYVHE